VGDGLLLAACVAGAYLLGSFPTASVVARRQGHDPTAEGSGNPGATNVYRLLGRRAGALVLAGDLVKGALAAGVGDAVAGRAGLLACGAAAVVGHCFPVLRWRHGGKGVASAAGVWLVAFPLVALVAAGLWALVAALTRKASLASLVAVVALPALAAASGRPGGEVAAAAAIAALVVLRHAGNVGRLLKGEERSLN
jgi:glycerol-3-phosphate acyltransferase PlsY